MSASTIHIVKSFVAAEAITKYAAVALDADSKLVIADDPDSITEMFIGIAQEACDAGDRISVVIAGDTFAIAGAAGIAASSCSLMAAAAGTGELVVHAFALGGTPNYLVGRLLPNENHTAPGAGELIRINVNSVYLKTA